MSISGFDNPSIEIITRAKNKDMHAFEALVYQYEKTVYNIAYRLLSNEEDAKDMAQEVFIKLYKNIENYQETAKFSTWLYTITYNTCIDEIRKRKNKPTLSMDASRETEDGNLGFELPDNAPTPEETLLQQESFQEIQAAMDTMSEDHKQFLIMRDIQDLSYTEIAEIASVSLGTVKSRISRARRQLKKILLASREQNSAVHV